MENLTKTKKEWLTKKGWGFFIAAVILFVLLIISVTHNEYGSNTGKDKTEQTGRLKDQINDLEKNLNDCSEKNKGYYSDDSTRKANEERGKEIKDSLSKMDLSSMGLVIPWNGKDIINVTSYGNDVHNSAWYSGLQKLFGKTGYQLIRKLFFAAPEAWENVFNSNQGTISWLKKTLDFPVDTAIVPYLTGSFSDTNGMQKKYVRQFKKYYTHVETGSNLFNDPQWSTFETNFFTKFPNAFNKNHGKLSESFKLWRSAYVIPNNAKPVLVRVIRTYNSF